VPSWQGGRMPLSADLGEVLRHTYNSASDTSKAKVSDEIEMKVLQPLFQLQNELSDKLKGSKS
jgi:ATP-dependent Lhr-like helicase